MNKKITTEGTISDYGHGKPFELPRGKYLVVIIAAAIIFGAIAYSATTPVKVTSSIDVLKEPPPGGDAVNLLLPAGTPQPTMPLTSAEIAISNWPKKEDWNFTCIQENADGRCVSYDSKYIGKECYGWNEKGTICLTYKDGRWDKIKYTRTN